MVKAGEVVSISRDVLGRSKMQSLLTWVVVGESAKSYRC